MIILLIITSTCTMYILRRSAGYKWGKTTFSPPFTPPTWNTVTCYYIIIAVDLLWTMITLRLSECWPCMTGGIFNLKMAVARVEGNISVTGNAICQVAWELCWKNKVCILSFTTACLCASVAEWLTQWTSDLGVMGLTLTAVRCWSHTYTCLY